MKCNHSFHQKNPNFKCHVNNQYEEGFRVSGAMLNKKKIQRNYASNKKKLDTGTCLKAIPWNNLLSFVYLMWHVACLITSRQTCWEYDSTTIQLRNTHTHTHTHRGCSMKTASRISLLSKVDQAVTLFTCICRYLFQILTMVQTILTPLTLFDILTKQMMKNTSK